MPAHPPQHPFRPSRRRADLCECGQLEQAHPRAPEPDPARSPDWEREYVATSTSTTIDATALIALAQARAHPGPLRGGRQRDWPWEGLEELADGANYVAWDEQLDDDPDGRTERQRHRIEALRSIAVAFWHLEQLHRLRRP